MNYFLDIFGKISVETPAFTLLKKTDTYEVRRYGPSVIAAVNIPSTPSITHSGGFRSLAGYIFGGNEMSEQIAMTAPVITHKQGNGMTMKFILPSQFKTTSELPNPNQENVQISNEKEFTVAVITFSGYVSDNFVAQQEQKLLEMLRDDTEVEVLEGSYPMLAQYNPPWTLPFLRTNDLMIPVHFSISE